MYLIINFVKIKIY